MKFVSLLLAILFSINALAALPLQGKGQGESSYAEINKLTVGNKLMTRVSATEVNIETGNFNIIDNPSFNAPVVSNATQGWTVTATGTATCTIATSTSSPMDGEKQYLVLTGLGGASGGTCSLKQSPTTSKRANAIVGFSYLPDPLGSCPGGNPTLTVRTLVNGTATTSQDGTNCGTSSTWQSFYVNEVTGSTSTGVEVLLTIPASTSSNFGIDRARVAPGDYTAPSVETQSYIANLTSGNAQNTLISSKGSGLFSVSTVSSKIRFTALKRVSMVVEGTSSYSSTAPTSCGAEVLFNGNHISGEQNFIASGGSNNQQCAAGGTSILDPGDYMEYDSYVYSGGTFSNGWVSVTAVSASQVQVLSSQCGANCETTFEAFISSTGVVSGEKLDWISGNCTANATNNACTLVSSVFSVAPNCTLGKSGGSGESYVNVTSDDALAVFFTNSSGSGGTKTDTYISCTKTGADYQASKILLGSTLDGVKSQGTITGADFQSVYFGGNATCSAACTTGTCTICRQTGTKITSVTFSSTGVYRLNGLDGTKYICLGTRSGATNGPILTDTNANQNASYAQVVGASSSTVENSYGAVYCFGDTL
jgi:hypothetical protein